MSGHGHVIPNADGSRARCGGPGMCAECSKELAQAWAAGQVEIVPPPPPRNPRAERARAIAKAVLSALERDDTLNMADGRTIAFDREFTEQDQSAALAAVLPHLEDLLPEGPVVATLPAGSDPESPGRLTVDTTGDDGEKWIGGDVQDPRCICEAREGNPHSAHEGNPRGHRVDCPAFGEGACDCGVDGAPHRGHRHGCLGGRS